MLAPRARRLLGFCTSSNLDPAVAGSQQVLDSRVHSPAWPMGGDHVAGSTRGLGNEALSRNGL